MLDKDIKEIYMCRKTRSVFGLSNKDFFNKSLLHLNHKNMGEDFTDLSKAREFTKGITQINFKDPLKFKQIPGEWVIFKIYVKEENIQVLNDEEAHIKVKKNVDTDDIEGCYLTTQSNKIEFYKNENFNLNKISLLINEIDKHTQKTSLLTENSNAMFAQSPSQSKEPLFEEFENLVKPHKRIYDALINNPTLILDYAKKLKENDCKSSNNQEMPISNKSVLSSI